MKVELISLVIMGLLVLSLPIVSAVTISAPPEPPIYCNWPIIGTISGCGPKIPSSPLPTPDDVCGWCGSQCLALSKSHGIVCVAILPPEGKSCVQQNGVCTIIDSNSSSVCCNLNGEAVKVDKNYCVTPLDDQYCTIGKVCPQLQVSCLCSDGTVCPQATDSRGCTIWGHCPNEPTPIPIQPTPPTPPSACATGKTMVTIGSSSWCADSWLVEIITNLLNRLAI